MPKRLLIPLVALLALGAAAATVGAWGGYPGYDNWNCNLQCYWGSLGGAPSDIGDYIGVQPGASDGYDLIDSKKPAEPMGDYVYAWFERPDWGVGRIMADWRSPIPDGTTKRWFVSSITDTWNVKTNIDNGPSGYFDMDCDFFMENEYPIAADIYITWQFGVAEAPPYPVPPDDYLFSMMYRGGINAKPAGTGGSVAPPVTNTIYDMEVTTQLVIPLWNDAFQPFTPYPECSLAASDTARFLFWVYNPDDPDPTCTIDVDPPSPQVEPATYTFTATAIGDDEPFTFSWDFGDGVTGVVGNPVSHDYNEGTYDVTCTITDANGDQGTCRTTVVVEKACEAPVCCFTYAPPSPVTVGDTVTFTDCSTQAPPNSVAAWEWDFENDGVIDSTAQNPTHVYTAPGLYTVCLTVYNDCDPPLSDTCCQEIEVLPVKEPPVCCIEGPIEVTVCQEACWLDCSYDPDGTIVSRIWYLDIPCEGLRELKPDGGFENGFYPIQDNPCPGDTGVVGNGWIPWVDGDCGWMAPYSFFDSTVEKCEGEHAQGVEYNNGSKGINNLVEGLVPGKAYLLRGCIRIDSASCWWAEFGCSDGSDGDVRCGGGCISPEDEYPADVWLWKSDDWGLGPPPGAWYALGPYHVTPVGTTLMVWYKFGNGCSVPSVGYADGVSLIPAPDDEDQDDQFCVHFTKKEDAGPHIITLVVTDNDGLTACCSQQINVVLPPCECGAITADPPDPDQGETVNLSVETVGCTPPVTYEWDFTCDSVYDYTAVDDNTAAHAYSECGTVTVCVRVTDSLQQQCEQYLDLFINCPPVCEISGPATAKAGELVCFSGTASDPDGGSIVLYEWDFGENVDATGLITNPSFETGDMTGWTNFGGIPLYIAQNPFWACGLVTPYGEWFVVRETCQGADQGGSYQQITGLNTDPQYTYRLTAHIVGFEADGGDPALEWVRVGADPTGGTDYTAGTVVWGPNAITPGCNFDPGWTTSADFATAGSGATLFFMCNTQDWACIGVHALDNLVLTRKGLATGPEACYTYEYDPLNRLITVTLEVTDDEGTVGTCRHEIEILPADNQKPVCDFDWSPKPATDLDTVQFTDLSYDPDPDDMIVSWLWDFGDGSPTSTEQNPQHDYADNGVYNVCLTVTDSGRGGLADPLSATCCKDVEILNVPPDCCIEGPTNGQVGEELCWESCSSDPDGTIVAYSWDKGDTPPNLKPDGGFETGFYAIADNPCPGDTGVVGNGWIPWVDGDCGWMAPYVYFDSIVEKCEGEHAQGVEMNTGSKGINNLVEGLTPGATYVLTACVRYDILGGNYWVEFGCSDGSDGDVRCGGGCISPEDEDPANPWLWKADAWGLGPPPGAWYNLGPFHVSPVGTSLMVWYKFGGNPGNALCYADGVTLTLAPEPQVEPVACHTYAEEGTYELCLTVTDDDGASTTCCQTITIQACPAPVCSFTYSTPSGDPPNDQEPVNFTDTSSPPPPQTITTWLWDFGDGHTSGAQNPSHDYAAGDYEVCLTVTNDCPIPASSTCCERITVVHINIPPWCEIVSGPATLTRGEEGCFEADAGDPDGEIVDYSWTLDGGTQSYGWWDMYEGDVVPEDAGWVRYEHKDPITDISEINPPGIWHLVDYDNDKCKMGKYPSDVSAGVTVVGRYHCIAANNSNNLFMPARIEGSLGNVNCRWDPAGKIRVEPGGHYVGSMPVSEWHTLRITLASGAAWNLYIDENPTPVASGTGGGTGGNRISIGAAATSNTGEFECDYVYIGTSGAYAPGDPMGPQIPGAPQGNRICATWDTLGVKTVCLTVTDDAGATAECCTTVEIVNIDPTCSITADPALSVVGRPTTLDAHPSDADGTVVSVDWDFGDGSPPGTGNPVDHTYMAAGCYTVVATVTDNDGGTGTCSAEVCANDPPVCIIDGPTTGKTCQELCFSAAESYDPDGGPLTYLWDMGDAGASVTLSDPSFETGAGWTMYAGGGMANMFGFCGYAPHSGAKFFGNATSWGHTSGGAYQQLSGCSVGSPYKASIWINSVSWTGGDPYPGNVHTHVGVDPAGGTDPAAASWSPDTSNMICGPGPYIQHSVTVTAASSTMTLFCEYYNDDAREWSMMALDDVALDAMPTSGTDVVQCVTYKECKTYTVTLTVTDDEGISTTCTQEVVITDGCPPEIVECPPNRTVQADENGEAPCPDLCPEVVAVDDCSAPENLTCTQDPPPGTTLYYGDTTVTLTICDEAGNCASCETVVTVGDGTPPEITCPDPGPYPVTSCTAPCPAASATDNVDPDPVVVQNPDVGEPLPPGSYVIEVEACDFSGNCSYAECPITVVDVTPPEITCPPDLVVCNDPGECSAAVDLITCETVPLDVVVNPSFEDGKTGWTDFGYVTMNHVCGTFWACGVTTPWGECFIVREICEEGPGGAEDIPGGVYQEVGGLPVGEEITISVGVVAAPGANYPHLTWGKVGFDPTGGTDYTAGTVIWGDPVQTGCHGFTPEFIATVTATTTSDTGTIFLRMNTGRWACISVNAFDNVVVTHEVCTGGPTVSDNCDIASVTNDGPGVYPVGDTTVTWEACDTSGNCSTCTQTVTVEDCEEPTVQCPEDITVDNDPGKCSAVVTFECSATDNCPGVSCACDPPSGTPFPVGTTTVTCTATDAVGLSDTCTFTVTVRDVEPPVATCPPDLTVDTDPGTCEASIDVSWIMENMTVEDNCAWPRLDAKPDSTWEVAWCGNIFHQIIPVTSPLYCFKIVVWQHWQDGRIDRYRLEVQPPGGGVYDRLPVVLGENQFELTTTDAAGNQSEPCIWTVTVVDNEPPVIECPPDVEVCTDPGACVATGVDLGTPTTSDNCEVASVSNDAPAAYPLGDTTVTWTACDEAGNCTSCTQLVTVIDCEPPTIECAAQEQCLCVDGGKVLGKGNTSAGATPCEPKDCPGTKNCWAKNTAGTCKSVTTTKKYTCTDPGTCVATGVHLCTPTASDNCEVASLTNDAPAAFPLGTTVVTWTACDGSGNCSTCAHDVVVEDCEPPTIVCPDDVTAQSEECEPIAVDIGMATCTDNCGTCTVSNDAPPVFPPGVTVVTWTACDPAGNCSTCEQTITVLCPPTCNITYTPASPTTDDLITFDSGASDPDGGTIVSVDWDFGDPYCDPQPDCDTATADPATYQYSMPGTYTVTVEVCDNDGLCVTCTTDVEVGKGTNIPPECGDPAITTDPSPPVATQPVELTSHASDPNPWGVIVSYEWDFDDGGTDTGNPVTHTFMEAKCYTVRVTVTDDQGGVTECSAQVCVRPLCDCDIMIDRTHCKLPAAGILGQCKRGQIGARNLGTEACDVLFYVYDNCPDEDEYGNEIPVAGPIAATIGPGQRIRRRFDLCYDRPCTIGRNMWRWEVWPAQCNELTPANNVHYRRVNVQPGVRTGWTPSSTWRGLR